MDFESLRACLLGKRFAREDRPFGPQALVYKVEGKMFALTPLEADPLRVTLKCDPDLARHLRSMYPAVQPAYHMNKKHWNTVVLDGSVPWPEVEEMIEDSYQLVVKGLSRAARRKIMGPD